MVQQTLDRRTHKETAVASIAASMQMCASLSHLRGRVHRSRWAEERTRGYGAASALLLRATRQGT